MITRIEVDGFKSLRNFVIDLEPFTVLIGPNSAGKSNILEAIALLSRLATQPISEAFKQGRGKSIDQFSRHGAETVQAINFAVEFLEYGPYPTPIASGDSTFQSRFRYGLRIERQKVGTQAERLVARGEYLRALPREGDDWIAAHPAFVPYAGYGYRGQDYFIAITDSQLAEQRIVGLPSHGSEGHPRRPTHTALAQTNYAAGMHIRRDLDDCRSLALGASSMGEPSERMDSGSLAPDASNLPTILAELPPNLLGEIRADLASLVPGIASFDVTPQGDDLHLDFDLAGGDRMPARLVSAGTLHLLALLTALRMTPRPSFLAVEEPENGIYPGRLRALLHLLKETSERHHEDEARAAFDVARLNAGATGALVGLHHNQLPTQILLTTHSPVALAVLRSAPQHLRLIDMVRRAEGRVTRARTIGEPSGGDPSRQSVSLREIDALLQSAQSAESA